MTRRPFARKTILGGLCAAAIILLADARVARGTTVAEDFDISNNPSSLGPWSYGYETTLGGTLTLYTVTTTLGLGIPVWTGGGPFSTPFVGLNSSGAQINTGGVLLDDDEMILHPGASGEVSVIRFSAPSNGTYSVSATFEGVDQGPTSTDVHVAVNNVAVFNDLVGNFKVPHAYSGLLTLNAGDIVDFAVGANGDFTSDSTGLFAEVSPVPEPASIALLATGLVGAVSSLARRRRSRT